MEFSSKKLMGFIVFSLSAITVSYSAEVVKIHVKTLRPSLENSKIEKPKEIQSDAVKKDEIESSENILFDAIQKNDVEEVERLLDIEDLDLKNKLVNSQNKFGETPLIVAVKLAKEYFLSLIRAEVDYTEIMLVCGGDRQDLPQIKNEIPKLEKLRKNIVTIIQIILDNGADLSIKDKARKTVFYYAKRYVGKPLPNKENCHTSISQMMNSTNDLDDDENDNNEEDDYRQEQQFIAYLESEPIYNAKTQKVLDAKLKKLESYDPEVLTLLSKTKKDRENPSRCACSPFKKQAKKKHPKKKSKSTKK